MRILMITPFFYPSLAGVETYVLSLSKNLALMGHEINILTMNTENALEYEEISHNIHVNRCKISLSYTKGFISGDFLKKILGSKNYDIYHVHVPFSFGLESAIIASKKNNIPLIVTHHGEGPLLNNIHIQTFISKLYNTFSRVFCFNFVDRVIFLTKSYCNSLRIGPLARKKVRIVRTGSEIGKFLEIKDSTLIKKKLMLKSEEKIILFVGSLSKYNRYKGVDFLIRAMKKIKEDDPLVKLLIIGEGELKTELMDLAAHCGIKDVVIFLGAIPNTEIQSYYSICDVFVLPSIHGPENGPMVVFEAMASSKPIVATKLPGLIDIVENSFGILVSPKDSKALSDAILKLIKNEALRKQMGEEARKHAEMFSWEKCAREMGKIYLEFK